MEKLLLKPMEAAEILDVGRSKMYELLATGSIRSIRIGRSIRIPVDALREFIGQREQFCGQAI